MYSHAEIRPMVAAGFQVACCTDFEEACRFVDEHTEPQTAGQYLIAPTETGMFGVYRLPPNTAP